MANNQLSLATQLAMLIAICAEAHKKQKDKGGKPYILHTMRVMMKFQGDFKRMMVAIAHDLVEDTAWTIKDLRDLGIDDEDVLAAISFITKEDGQTYFEYITGVKNNTLACDVKKEDIQDNSLLTRQKGLRHKDFTRVAKYNAAFQYLEDSITAEDFKAVLNDIGVS
jgi:(p)ppGpp synthase/HD superfamily hydrolase